MLNAQPFPNARRNSGAAIAVALPYQAGHTVPLRPIFYDESGYRKLAVYILSSAIVLALAVVVVSFIISVSRPPNLPRDLAPRSAVVREVSAAPQTSAPFIPAQPAGPARGRQGTSRAAVPVAQPGMPE